MVEGIPLADDSADPGDSKPGVDVAMTILVWKPRLEYQRQLVTTRRVDDGSPCIV